MTAPLTFTAEKVVYSAQFRTAAAVQALARELFDDRRERAQDFGTWLFLVWSPDSIYRKLAPEDRSAIVLSQQIKEPEWLESCLKHETAKEVISLYQELVLSPGERLQNGLLTEIRRYIQEIAQIKADTAEEEGIDIIQRIKRGRELHKMLGEVEEMLAGEEKAKIRGGYQKRLFEDKPDDMQ